MGGDSVETDAGQTIVKEPILFREPVDERCEIRTAAEALALILSVAQQAGIPRKDLVERAGLSKDTAWKSIRAMKRGERLPLRAELLFSLADAAGIVFTGVYLDMHGVAGRQESET